MVVTYHRLASLLAPAAIAALALFSAVMVCLPAAPAPLDFTNVAAAAGIRADIHCGSPEKRWITEANGTGLAWLDFDNDGKMDLLITNGSGMEQLRKILAGTVPDAHGRGVYLFHNLGGGKFEDVTEKAGLRNDHWGTGANAADFDNDGYTDILITTIGRDLLYRNNRNGTFSEVSKAAGLSQSLAWHTGSAFGDFDGDGFLDLFITGYVDIHSLDLKDPAPVCDYQGLKVFCGPIGLKGEHGILYHNNHDGTFRDVTTQAGLGGLPAAHGFTVVADDFNGDGKTDLLVANDSDPNWLFLNQGNGTFKESALERGVGFNADGRAQSNMGVAVGLMGEECRLGIVTTTFAQDYFPFFVQDKSGFFEDVAASNGLATVTNPYLGWASGFADFDNSGQLSLWTANGHVYPQSPIYFEPIVLFRMVAGKFTPAFRYPSGAPDNSYRGGATGDFDNDGKLDIAVLPISGQPVLLNNKTHGESSWAGFSLHGSRSNRDAIGASLRLEACGRTQARTVRNGGSYISRDDPRVHFGLGACAHADRLTITWPSGRKQVIADPAVNRYSDIEEPR